MSKVTKAIFLAGLVVFCVVAVLIGYIALDHDPQGAFSQDTPYLLLLCVIWAVAVFLPFGIAGALVGVMQYLKSRNIEAP